MARRTTKLITISKDNITERTLTLEYYFRDVNKYPLLTPDDELKYIVRYKNGDDRAGEKVIQSNLRFVISVAKQFISTGVPLSDLISAGNAGLVLALKKFDHTKGFKFISYGVWWVRQAIMQEIVMNARMIRLPAQVNALNNLHKRETGSDMPNVAELHVSSFDKKRNDDESNVLDTLSSNLFNSPDNFVIGSSPLRTAIEQLNQQEQAVIKMRYGIGQDDEFTFAEISRELGNGLSAERIRQIHARAVRKLKARISKTSIESLT